MATESASATRFFVADEAQSVRRDLVELGVGYALILATVWTANPTQRVFFWLSCLWIITTSWSRHEGWKALGLGFRGMNRSLWIVGAALLGAWLAIFVASRMHTLHRLHGPSPLLSHGWGYVVWAVMQQFILQGYFLLRLLRLLPGKAPVVAAAGMFALAHLPNPILTPITFLWGVAACLLFLRYRNIYTLGLAHGILGLCLAITVPNSLHHHMRVGLGYYRYHSGAQDRPPGSHRNQTDQRVSTDAWVTADAPTRRC